MIRVSEAQFSLLQANVRGSAPKRAGQPRQRRRREDLPENILVRQICDFLRARGWTLTRQHIGTFVPYRIFAGRKRGADEPIIPVRVGESGQADWRAERRIEGGPPGACTVLYFECKAPGRKPRPEQLLWLERYRLSGALAGWFDCFQDAEFGGAFVDWYEEHVGER